jgi:hypothetical protein
VGNYHYSEFRLLESTREDRIEFTLDQLKKMSSEDSEKDKEDRGKETD